MVAPMEDGRTSGLPPAATYIHCSGGRKPADRRQPAIFDEHKNHVVNSCILLFLPLGLRSVSTRRSNRGTLVSLLSKRRRGGCRCAKAIEAQGFWNCCKTQQPVPTG